MQYFHKISHRHLADFYGTTNYNVNPTEPENYDIHPAHPTNYTLRSRDVNANIGPQRADSLMDRNGIKSYVRKLNEPTDIARKISKRKRQLTVKSAQGLIVHTDRTDR